MSYRKHSKTPNSKISNSLIYQTQRYDRIRKSYDLRQKECEYNRDFLDRSYERALDLTMFGMDSTYIGLGPSKPKVKPTRRSNSIFSNNLSQTPRTTTTSPKVSLYSNYSNYANTNTPYSNEYQRRYFKLPSYRSHDLTLQSGSPRFGFSNHFSNSKSKKTKSSNNEEIDVQNEEEEIENQEENQNKQPSKSTKISSINETSNTEESSIKALNGQNQPSQIEAGDFDGSNSNLKANTRSSSKSNSSSSKNKKNNECASPLGSPLGSPSGSGFGAHLYSFENRNQSSKTKEKSNINISFDIDSDKNNKNDNNSDEMMQELHASELESTPHGSFFEEEEEEVEINSNDIINIDNDENFGEEEEINQIDLNINSVNEEEEGEEENENIKSVNDNDNNANNKSKKKESENSNSNENVNKSHRSISIEDEIEFNKHLNTVAQNLQSISSNIRTGSSSNPHSEMMNNSNDEVGIMTTPNRAESSKLKNQSMTIQNKEFTIAHSASSDFSPVVFGKNQSEISSDDSQLTSNDGIPKPIIDSPKVKNQKGKKV